MSPAGASKVQGILQEIARQLEAAAEAKIISIESNGLGPQAVANSIADMHNGDEIVIAAPSVRVRFSMVSTCSRCDIVLLTDCACVRLAWLRAWRVLPDGARSCRGTLGYWNSNCYSKLASRSRDRLCARRTSSNCTPWTGRTASRAQDC